MRQQGDPIFKRQHIETNETTAYCEQKDMQADCHQQKVGDVDLDSNLETIPKFQYQLTSFKPRKKCLSIEEVNGWKTNRYRVFGVEVKLKTVRQFNHEVVTPTCIPIGNPKKHEVKHVEEGGNQNYENIVKQIVLGFFCVSVIVKFVKNLNSNEV